MFLSSHNFAYLLMRRVIRAAYLGEDAGDLSALENPKAVEEIMQKTQPAIS